MNQVSFNEVFRRRSKQFAIQTMRFCSILPKNEEARIIKRQLIRSVTSVAANFRAVCIARSQKERYAKYCIVVEEADETSFWLELLEESHLNIKVPIEIKNEAFEIAKVMSSMKKKLKPK